MAGAAGSVFIGVSVFVFFAILVGLMLHRIIGLYIEGAIGGIQCLIISAAYLVTIGAIIVVPSMAVRVVLSLLLLAVIILIPVILRNLGRGEARSFDDEKMDQYRRAIDADPLNLAARQALAQTLYRQGRLVEAIEEQKQLVTRSRSNQQEIRRLEQLETELKEKEFPPITCPSCGRENEYGRTRCLNCEGELSVGREIRKWLTQGGLRQIVVATSITIGICAVVMFALSIIALPIRIGLVALILLVLISAEYLYIQRNW